MEKIIIGGWLLGKHLADIDLLNEEDFPNYSELYKAIKEQGTADAVGLCKRCHISYKEMAELPSYYSESLYKSAVDKLRRKSLQKYLANITSEVDVSEVMDVIDRYSRREPDLKESFKGWAMSFMEDLDERSQRVMVNTGIPSLDNILYGLRTGELTSIAARPGVGKSTFVQQVAMRVARQRQKVVFLALEMSGNQLIERMIKSGTDGLLRGYEPNIPQYELRKGKFTDNKVKELVNKRLEDINRLEEGGNFVIYEGVRELEEIEEIIRVQRPYMLVIDQLEQLRDSRERFDSKRARFSHMTNRLKALSMDADICIWLACQLNRGADDVAPTMANLKESGSIEEDSDNIILLHWIKDGSPIRSIQLEVAKQRQGSPGITRCAMNPNKFLFFDEAMARQ